VTPSGAQVFDDVRAIQRIRFTGPPLVDENDVPLDLNASEPWQSTRGEGGGARTWAAGKDKQGIRSRVAPERRSHHDLEMESATGSGLRVLEYLKRSAVSVDRPFAGRAWMESVENDRTGSATGART
jgi:hypothetical protein